MKTTQAQNLVFEFSKTMLPGQKGQTDAGLSFMSLLENAMQPELPMGAETVIPGSGNTSGKADKAQPEQQPAKEKQQQDVDPSQAVAVTEPQPQPQPEDQPPAEENLPAIAVVAEEGTVAPQLPELVRVEEEAVQTVTPAQIQQGEAPILPEQPAIEAEVAAFIGEVVVAEASEPESQLQTQLQQELLSVARPVQANPESAQQTFDQLVAKSTEALTAKEAPAQTEQPQQDAQPQNTIEATAVPQAAQPRTADAPPPTSQQQEAASVEPRPQQAEEQPETTAAAMVKEAVRTEPEKAREDIPLAGVQMREAVTEAPVPTAQADKAQPAMPAQQVQTRIIENLEQEKMEFRMQLNPQQLGKIDVKMVLESGRLTVEIISASAKTAELLKGQADGLAASLRMSAAGLQSVQVVTQTQNENSHMEQSLNMAFGSNESAYGESQTEQSGEAGAKTAGRGAETEQTAAESAEGGQQVVSSKLLDYAI